MENGKTAEKATTELVFTSSDGKSKRIDYARWWDKDTELFSTTPLYLKSLKQIDIEPGHPEDLVLAFRKKEGKTIYSHYYTDYKNIDERYEDNKLGIPPIDVSIKLQGKFKPVEFDRILDLDDEDNFLLREKQWE